MSGMKRKESDQSASHAKGILSLDGLIQSNSLNHHTDDYESDAFILRRGQSFELKVVFDGEIMSEELNQLHVVLKTGKNPKRRNKTWIDVCQRSNEDEDDWYFTVVKRSADYVVIALNIPSNTLVSKYSLSAKFFQATVHYSKDVFILFNPWCEHDEVYMEDEMRRNEYVLNDTGFVYTSNRRPKPWNFAQFSDVVFRCVFDLLESIRRNWRDSAREVVRNLSARANSFDNDGVLVGNWSGDYSGGKKPWQWNGSRKIFETYVKTKAPVKYGQCWVFSGIMNTMMRGLGIPCRSVTNYSSAHDTDNNCTFDKYFDEEMNYLEDESDDSCWNFHVWNDVWMSRPDLPAGMGGWQAVDGTPQEESRGIYRCGPASLQAIKEGYVQYNYDSRFVFAEVNADTVFWKRYTNENGDHDFKPVRVKSNSVGFNITTKSPNSFWQKEDVTSDYKYPEGSILEHAAVRNALKKSKNPVISHSNRDIKFKSTLPYETECDDGVTLQLKATNTSENPLTVNIAVTGQLVRYTGVVLKTLPKKTEYKVLNGSQDLELSFFYGPEEYLDCLDENVTIRLSYMANIKETGQSYVSQKICTINKPDLKVELVDPNQTNVKSGEEVRLKVTLPTTQCVQKFTDLTINMEGSIMNGEIERKLTDSQLSEDSQSFETSFVVKESLKANKDYELIVSVDSEQITGMAGEVTFRAA